MLRLALKRMREEETFEGNISLEEGIPLESLPQMIL